MATQIFANGASALLAASIDDNDLTIQVASGYGALFPSPGVDEYFLITLQDASGDYEIAKITSRSTDLLTVDPAGRGMEGTSAVAWVNGVTRVEVRSTKGTFDAFLQKTGGAMSGNVDMNENNVVDAHLTGTATQILAGQIVGVPMRGTVDDASNELAVPAGGGRATAGGIPLLVNTDETAVRALAYEVGMIMQWFGAAINVPAGWAICNGANGTPDLRDKFVVGAGTTYALGDTGGSANTGNAGAHTHDVTVGAHALTIAEMPAHDHGFVAAVNGPGDRNLSFGAAFSIAASLLTDSVGGGDAHTHPGGTTTAAVDHAHSALPPYHALYYIMYTG